jgi:type I protein arginine methyltransferase
MLDALNEDKNEKVDIIISEWMGYALYYENMLSSVIYARDKWLNPNKGCIMPSNATIYIDAMTANNDDDRLGFWYNVYGFNMSDVTDLFVKESQVQYVNNDQCIGKKCSIHTLNIMTANGKHTYYYKTRKCKRLRVAKDGKLQQVG